MYEFENTARNANNSEDRRKCPYYDDCYLQVRQGGICYTPCGDNPNDKKFEKEKKMKEFIEKLIERLEEEIVYDTFDHYKEEPLINMSFERLEDIINQLAEEYKDTNVSTIDAGELFNDGWIPYATDCKMPNEASRVWLSFTTPIASFVKSAWYINGHFEWDNCRRVKETPMAWKPYNAPAPYQPKEQ